MYIHVYLAIICMTYIALLVSRARCLPSVSLFHPPAPNLGAVFPVAVFLFVPSFSPPASIPFVITEDESRVIGTRSFRVTISPTPFPDPPIPFYNWHCVPFSFRTSLLKYA